MLTIYPATWNNCLILKGCYKNIGCHVYFLSTFQRATAAGTSNPELSLTEPGMYQMDITLKSGHNLAARDRRGKVMLTVFASI